MSYQANRQRSDFYLPWAKTICRDMASVAVSVAQAGGRDDRYGCDLILTADDGDGRIAFRVRRTEYRDLTLRHCLPGYEAEWFEEHKLMAQAEARWYLYAWVAEWAGPVVAWMWVDLDVLRQHWQARRDDWKVRSNGEDGMLFRCIPATALEEMGALVRYERHCPDPAQMALL